MNVAKMNSLRKAAFSPLTIFKSQRQEMLADAIRLNPDIFIELAIQHKLRPQEQMELMSFFLDLAIKANYVADSYIAHINLLLKNLTYTWLWPSSVALLGTNLARIGIKLYLPTTSYE